MLRSRFVRNQTSNAAQAGASKGKRRRSFPNVPFGSLPDGASAVILSPAPPNPEVSRMMDFSINASSWDNASAEAGRPAGDLLSRRITQSDSDCGIDGLTSAGGGGSQTPTAPRKTGEVRTPNPGRPGGTPG